MQVERKGSHHLFSAAFVHHLFSAAFVHPLGIQLAVPPNHQLLHVVVPAQTRPCARLSQRLYAGNSLPAASGLPQSRSRQSAVRWGKVQRLCTCRVEGCAGWLTGLCSGSLKDFERPFALP